jgi:HlyD family secretion protein
MTRPVRARRLFWPFIMVAAVAASIIAGFRFAGLAATPAVTSPSPSSETAPADHEGVVCFGTVDLEHGVASLDPLQPGRVALVLVSENQHVDQGTELVRLDDATAQSRLAAANAAVKLAQLQLAQAREQPKVQESRIAQQEAMRKAMASRASAARSAQAREEKLSKSVNIDDTEKSISLDKVREMEALEQAEAERLAELKAQDTDAGIRRAAHELKAAEARRDEAKTALEECHLRAPRAGTVLRIMVGPGDVPGARPGQPAVLFAIDGPQVIRATVEQEFAARVKKDAPVLVHDEADQSITWRGRVDRVAGWYSQRRTILHDPSQLTDVRTLECVITLEPGQPSLRLGQSVRVFINSVR